ncbi:hypothetical protein BpHYR1_050572 [Brachionus plicatilis]|uniref:Uncharacterized protein n=1 Tax=Brachionus plicatilis TaxID=10195 RepID=A0A3M7PBR5_BRAPC|nr:hypothetical protein BpHYR1_050572 [Brachionus plicatilis]
MAIFFSRNRIYRVLQILIQIEMVSVQYEEILTSHKHCKILSKKSSDREQKLIPFCILFV